jgi:hypothetical protein
VGTYDVPLRVPIVAISHRQSDTPIDQSEPGKLLAGDVTDARNALDCQST